MPKISNFCDTTSKEFLLFTFVRQQLVDKSSICGFGFTEFPNVVDKPIFSPEPSVYSSFQSISISTRTEGATIYYTMDGSNPTANSTKYSTPFNIWLVAGKTIRAIGIKAGINDSPVSTGIFSYLPLRTGQITSYAAGDDASANIGVNYSFSGPIADATYPSDYTTKDNATGILWKSCSEGLSGINCLSGALSANSFTNITTSCSNLNSQNGGNGYAGKTTWRLPTLKELYATNDAGKNGNTILDSAAFPNTANFAYWASTSYPANSAFAWYLDYSGSNSYANTIASNYHGRCVASSIPNESFAFVDNGDGTIKDNVTGLTWQKCSSGLNNDASCSGTATTMNWATALTTCSALNLASKSWRLPNRNELITLFDYTKSNGPTIERIFFPNTVSSALGYYWTSTTNAAGTTFAFYVNFTTTVNNIFDVYLKTNLLNVRCVSGP
jgi:hypothetical protein